MRINNIVLYNFGSYEGETVFDTRTDESGKNIILVGGKNGAGKTTLFTAMRVCLYGYMSMGYKNANAYYHRAIIKLINNSAKMSRPTHAHVEMQIGLSNGREIELYTLKRGWILSEALTEYFGVIKNGVPLSDSEVADFEKYVLSLIPPELFNLYFFDGEKIADFFLEEGGNARIKEAFLTLCGYDTFEIMRRNFKRISSGRANASPDLEVYLEAKDAVALARSEHEELSMALKQCIDEMAACEADIIAADKEYHQKGGVTQEEWNKKLFALKEEEKKREAFNAYLKKWANDMVPFLMVRDQIMEISQQIDKENSALKYRNFCEVLKTPAVQKLLNGRIHEIQRAAAVQFDNGDNGILNLSLEQSALLLAQIKKILDFDASKIAKCKRAIKQSVETSAKIRQELEASNVSSVQEYMKKRAQLFEYKSLLLVQQIELEQKLVAQKERLQQAEAQLARAQSRIEDELKKASIMDISTRAIVMLDKLQQTLYRRQIEKVEDFFRIEIKNLMRKSRFIDDIHIDDDFSIHIYRNDDMQVDQLIDALSTNSEAQIVALLGSAAMRKLKEMSGDETIEGILFYLGNYGGTIVTIPVEIDKTSLSNGEKQIFIMALYHS